MTKLKQHFLILIYQKVLCVLKIFESVKNMDIKNNLNKVKYYFRRYGFLEVSKKVFKRVFHIKENRKTNQEQYKIWMEKHKLTTEEIENQKNYKFNYNPKISVVVPMYNTDEVFFKELIESLNGQTYSNWELCLADGSQEQNENLKKHKTALYYTVTRRLSMKYLSRIVDAELDLRLRSVGATASQT